MKWKGSRWRFWYMKMRYRWVNPESHMRYLIQRTNHRDRLFKQIEEAILERKYGEALVLAREGWQLAGR